MEKIVKIDNFSGKDLKSALKCKTLSEKAAASLKQGKIIGVPTDTIYGIAALAQSNIAVESIYNIKQRHREKPIAICVADTPDIYRWCDVTVSEEILRDLLPGPVTLIFKRKPALNPDLNPATELVGVRIPDHQFIRETARICGEPIALTSANLSASQSCLKIEEFQYLWEKLDLVFDGGCLGNTDVSRYGSTVVDLSVPGVYKIIRDGCALSAVEKTLKAKFGLSEVDRT